MASISKPYRRGLVVGKFCPLHLGHEYLIQQALDACDEVILLSYSQPDFADYPPSIRQWWLEQRFPQARVWVLSPERLRQYTSLPLTLPDNNAADSMQRQFVAEFCNRVLRVRIDAVFTSEAYGSGFAQALSEYFTMIDGQECTVASICVDPERNTVPISGTQIRRNPSACSAFLSPLVAQTLRPRIAILGGESSGKTTFAAALAKALSCPWVPEYGRTLWEQRQGQLSRQDLSDIAVRQIHEEHLMARESSHVVVCDTTPLTTQFYAEHLFGGEFPDIRALAQRSYAVTFLCAPDFPFVQDGTRQDELFRSLQHHWYTQQLERQERPYTLLTGGLTERLQQALQVLATAI